jgi:hypothetical protein
LNSEDEFEYLLDLLWWVSHSCVLHHGADT